MRKTDFCDQCQTIMHQGMCNCPEKKPCGCKGDCACTENFEQSARMKKHFEEHGSIFEK